MVIYNVYGNNSRHRLKVTSDSATIDYAKNSTALEQYQVREFFAKVVSQMKPPVNVQRGSMKIGYRQIILQGK